MLIRLLCLLILCLCVFIICCNRLVIDLCCTSTMRQCSKMQERVRARPCGHAAPPLQSRPPCEINQPNCSRHDTVMASRGPWRHSKKRKLRCTPPQRWVGTRNCLIKKMLKKLRAFQELSHEWLKCLTKPTGHFRISQYHDKRFPIWSLIMIVKILKRPVGLVRHFDKITEKSWYALRVLQSFRVC